MTISCISYLSFDYKCFILSILISLLPCGCQKVEVGPSEQIFNIKSGDATLAAKLWIPGPGKHPVFIFVEGETARSKESYAQTAEFFMESGLAVLAYDKRGNFKSTGTKLSPTVANSNETFELLASDLVSIVEFLKTIESVEASKIGLFCTDQGVWIGTIAQTKTGAISCSVNIVGCATSVGIRQYYHQLSGGDLNGNNTSGLTRMQIDEMVSTYSEPQGFDPKDALLSITAPQFWLMGGADFSYPVRQTDVILKDLISNHGKNIDIVIEPNANHVMYDIVERKQLGNGDLIASWFGEKFFNQ